MRPRLQFSLRTLLIVVLAIACFLGGAAWQKRRDQPVWVYLSPPADEFVEIIRLPDGSEWQRMVQPSPDE